jgi:hypothetical protein
MNPEELERSPFDKKAVESTEIEVKNGVIKDLGNPQGIRVRREHA